MEGLNMMYKYLVTYRPLLDIRMIGFATGWWILRLSITAYLDSLGMSTQAHFRNTLAPQQNGQRFAEDALKLLCLKSHLLFSADYLFVHEDSVHNKSILSSNCYVSNRRTDIRWNQKSL